MEGVVKLVKANEGYGFIRGTDGRDYFFHKSALKNVEITDLTEGREVTFEDAEGPKGRRAEDVFA